MGKIAQRISSRQSWAGKWADRVSRALREARRAHELEEGGSADEPDGFEDLLVEPIEELLSREDRREYRRAVELLDSALSTRGMNREADSFFLLLEDFAGRIAWEQGEGEARRFGESQFFAVGLVVEGTGEAPAGVLDEAACERLRSALVESHQLTARGRVVLLPVLLHDGRQLGLDDWQERRLAQGLQDWASRHPGTAHPPLEEARRILARAEHDNRPPPGPGRDRGGPALHSLAVVGLIVPPGEPVDGAPAAGADGERAPIGAYFPRQEMADVLYDLLDAEAELGDVLQLRRGVTPPNLAPEDVKELKALYEDDMLVDLEGDLEEVRGEIEALRREHPQLAQAVESGSDLDEYQRKVAEALAPLTGGADGAAGGLRHATQAGLLLEVVAATFESHRRIGFELGAQAAARAVGRAGCEGLLADVIVDEEAEALDVVLLDGSVSVHEALWPPHHSEDYEAAADALFATLEGLGIRLVNEAEQEDAPAPARAVEESAPAAPTPRPAEPPALPAASRSAQGQGGAKASRSSREAGEADEAGDSRPSRSRRGRSLH
ncbi:hypothetical protein [Caldimonas tepidiphila]|uniref:hypothetical protein n=1 Tax=Caldimonas tepidiphila TaxID=2315841 RepID=UPI000E5A9EF5|nr:hypothetical protein [Caldimonas tepidiphila]